MAYDHIKPSTLEGIQSYVHQHCPPGGFLRAVLENNLQEAVIRADKENLMGLREIVQYVYWEVPHLCWGSPAKVKAWLEVKSETLQTD